MIAKFNFVPAQVPVLFCMSNSIYNEIGCDTFDLVRDAFSYNIDRPVIAHPPCRLWSRMRGLSNAPACEKLTGIWAVKLVQDQGGVLEHPAGSKLWPHMSLPMPGSIDKFGGFTICVNQHWFGHLCQKKTLLYIVGITELELPDIPLNFDAVEYQIGHLARHKSPKKVLPNSMNSYTPINFALFLIEIQQKIWLKKQHT
ncbi:MAG TPA: hypothetical protein PK987_09745 [Ferruginibacter sp.]|nr:hypothetical protein [Ferruginibacter sp.]